VIDLNAIKHYVDLKFLGSGWFGKVYAAYDTQKNIVVAIKEIEDLEKAKSEIVVMKSYSSKYLPTYYESFYQNNKAYIVMEYIDGQPLGGPLFENGTPKSEKLSVKICIKILKSLRDLHHAGYAHNDIVPKNFMIKDDLPHTIKLIDFGSAYPIHKPWDIQRELQKVAEMCVYLITGKSPGKLSGNEIPNQKLNQVLLRTFEHDERKRYQSAKEFMRALKVFVK
jgi:serine/threonine protein kinase